MYNIVLLIFLFTNLCLNDVSKTCPEWMKVTFHSRGPKLFGNTCYVLSRGKDTWANGEKECAKNGGHLAIIHNKSINEYMNEIDVHYSMNIFWIGARDSKDDPGWVWTDGQPVIFTDWHNGGTMFEMQAFFTGIDLCLIWSRYLFESNGYWKKWGCGETKNYLCEGRIINDARSLGTGVKEQDTLTEGMELTKNNSTRHIRGAERDGYFTKVQLLNGEHGMMLLGESIKKTSTRSVMQCIAVCLQHPDCNTVSHHKKTTACNLYYSFDPTKEHVVNMKGWVVYSSKL